MRNKGLNPYLTRQDIQKGTANRCKKYKNLNFYEQYAMYMGVTQLLEIGLKTLLSNKFNYDFEKITKFTLGQTAKELKKNKLRQDFTILLDSVVDSRNYIAHEILANELLLNSILKEKISKRYFTKDYRILSKAIFELEQLTFLFDWTQENNGWD